MKKNIGILVVLLSVFLITALLEPRFLNAYNLQNIARWTSLFAILAIGEAFVIISGGIDLSVGSIVGLTGSLLPMLLTEHNLPPLVAVPAVIGLAAVIGIIHGLLIAKLRLQPFIVTLCGLFIYRGMARFITGDSTQGFGTGYDSLKYLANGHPFSLPIPFVGWIQVPMPLLIMAAIAAAGGVFLNRSMYGRYLLALGRNEHAAHLSGIPTHRMIILAYTLSATLAGIAGVLFSLNLTSVPPSNFGNFYELYAVAGCVLGGCSLRGGQGSLFGVIIGTAIVRVLYNSINMLGIATQLEFAVIGSVILIGVTADELMKRVTGKT